jgi:hypothetical protein
VARTGRTAVSPPRSAAFSLLIDRLVDQRLLDHGGIAAGRSISQPKRLGLSAKALRAAVSVDQ